MGLPASYPLALYRGDAIRLQFQVWQDAAKTQPADLTSAVAKAEIRNQPGGATIVLFTCTITAPNLIDLFLPAEQSRLVPPRGVWDLQLTFAAGDVTTIVAGSVTQTADVTDSTLTPTIASAASRQTQGRSLRLVSGF